MMKHRFLQLGVLLFCLLALALLLPAVTAEAASAQVDPSLCYGRNALLAMEDGARYVQAYDAILAADRLDAEEHISLDGFNLTRDEFFMVLKLYCDDHPEKFWHGENFSYWGNGRYITEMAFTNNTDMDPVLFEAYVQDFLAVTDGLATEYEKALALHDELVKRVTYDSSAPHAHSAYGALVDGLAVCEGYANAYQLLLQRCGILCYGVTGDAGGGHKWNMLRLDGAYYYTDVTWDDPTLPNTDFYPLCYTYFNVPTEWISEDHTPDDPYGILPESTDLSMLFDKYILPGYTVDSVASSCYREGDYILFSYCNTTGETDPNTFFQWFYDNFFEILQKAELWDVFDGSMWSLPRTRTLQVYLYIPCAHTFETVSAVNPTCQSLGHAAYQVCTSCGKQFDMDGNELEKILRYPMIDHVYGNVLRVEPTCVEEGYIYQLCTTCGNRHLLNTLPADEQLHDWQQTYSAPASCTASGYVRYTCAYCGKNRTETLPALGHTLVETVIPPTCVNNGLRSCSCTTCGELLSYETLPATGHTPGDWVVTVEPSSDAPGERCRFCTVCETVLEREAIPSEPANATGDLNGDGKLNLVDYLLLKRYCLDLITLQPAQKAAADVNHDGKVNALDYLRLKKAIVSGKPELIK